MNPSNHYIASLATAFFAVLFCINTAACAHEFETGHIERSIDVIVRGQKIEVKYSIGLADETIVDWLVREELLAESEEARFRDCIAKLEEAEARKTKTSDTDPESNSQEKKSEEADSPNPLEFQTELMKLLRDKLADSVCEKLVLRTNGVQIEIAETSVSNPARHHVAMEIILKAELPSKAETEFSLVDGNFLDVVNDVNEKSTDAVSQKSSDAALAKESSSLDECPDTFRYFGNIRLACRVKGNAVQVNSNVAPIIARANVTEVGSLTLDERIEAATIRTKIGFAGPEGR